MPLIKTLNIIGPSVKKAWTIYAFSMSFGFRSSAPVSSKPMLSLAFILLPGCLRGPSWCLSHLLAPALLSFGFPRSVPESSGNASMSTAGSLSLLPPPIQESPLGLLPETQLLHQGSWSLSKGLLFQWIQGEEEGKVAAQSVQGESRVKFHPSQNF